MLESMRSRSHFHLIFTHAHNIWLLWLRLSSNYAGGIMPQALAAKKGYSQILWLFNDQVTEVGTMNIFFLWVNKQGLFFCFAAGFGLIASMLGIA